MDMEFYAKLYDAEWQRTDQLQNAVGTPLGVLVLLGGALLVLAQQFRSDARLVEYVFWSCYAVACGAFCTSVYMAVRSYHGYEYRRLPFPSNLMRYYQRLKDHYWEEGKPGLADVDFTAYLTKSYIVAADANAAHNLNRSEYLNKANRALIAALVATALCAIPHTVALRTGPTDPQKIEIVNR